MRVYNKLNYPNMYRLKNKQRLRNLKVKNTKTFFYKFWTTNVEKSKIIKKITDNGRVPLDCSEMKIENEVGSGGTVEKYSGGKIELPLPLKIENRSKKFPSNS